MSLTLNWTDIECSLFKPAHYLQACTKNLPNLEGVVCKKIINSRSKVMLSYRIDEILLTNMEDEKNMCCELTKPACSGCGWWQVREKLTNPSWVHLSWFPQHGHGLHLSSAHPAILWSLMKWQEPFVTSSSNRKVCPEDNLEFVGCCERQIGGTNFTWDGQTIHATPQTCEAESINQSIIYERLIDGNLCNKLPQEIAQSPAWDLCQFQQGQVWRV